MTTCNWTNRHGRLLLGFADKIGVRNPEKMLWGTQLWGPPTSWQSLCATGTTVQLHTAEQSGFEVLPHSADSPGLAPSDFFLFPNLKKLHERRRFHDNKDAFEAVEIWLGALSSVFTLIVLSSKRRLVAEMCNSAG